VCVSYITQVLVKPHAGSTFTVGWAVAEVKLACVFISAVVMPTATSH